MVGLLYLDSTSLIPTQDYLVDSVFEQYRHMILAGLEDQIAPVPVVKDFFSNGFRALDGHNRSSAWIAAKGIVPSWEVESPRDLIPYAAFPAVPKERIDETNKQIRRRFDQALFYQPCDETGEAITSFEQLMARSLNSYLCK